MNKIYLWFKKNQVACQFFLLAALLATIILLPLFRTGYVADGLANYDNYLNPDTKKLLNWNYFADVSDFYIRSGRYKVTPNILNLLILPLNTSFIFASQLMTVACTFASIVWFLYWINGLEKKQNWWWSCVIILPLIFQIRNYHDPFLVYFGGFQLYACLLFLSLWFFTIYLNTNKLRWAWSSIIIFFLFVNGHEANIILWSIFPLVYWLAKRKFWGKQFWPIIINAGSCIFAYFTAQIFQFILQIPQTIFIYNGTALNFDLIKIIKAFLMQIFAALPLSFFISWPGQESLSYYPHVYFDYLPILLMAAVIFYLLFKILFKKIGENKSQLQWRQIIWLALIGLALWLLPAIPVAVSPKYQRDLLLYGTKSGVGYLMVYYQYFGVALLGAIIIYLIYRYFKYKKFFFWLLVTGASLIFYFTYCSNMATTKQINKAYDEQRFLVTQANQSDFFAPIKNNLATTLYLNHRDTNYYYLGDRALYQGKIFYSLLKGQAQINRVCNQNNLSELKTGIAIGECQENFSKAENNYFIYFDQVDEYAGYIILAPVTDFYQGIPMSNQIEIFYYSSYLNENQPSYLYQSLLREIHISYYALDEHGQPQRYDLQKKFSRLDGNTTIIDFESERMILLDSIVPALIQNDRESFKVLDAGD